MPGVPDTSRFLTALRRAVRSLTGGTRSTDVPTRTVLGAPGSPGQTGPGATVQVDPARLRRVRLGYAPSRDGEPDPGEIVWTWVPYEENDGRGKDRPVVIVAASHAGEWLAVQLTSKAHDADRDYVSLGSGDWDASGRPSWARIDRLFRVRTDGMRREAAALDAPRFERVAAALATRYGWR